MFKPRHGYRSPITHRYRGNAKGCPVFNNLDEITSDMVEDHDECLECLAKLKNRIDIYRNLVENNKPSNTVIKSLQKLSSSSSNNRLKTCLQFLIIKVNENTSTSFSNNNQISRNNLKITDEFQRHVSNHVSIDDPLDSPTRSQITRRQRNISNLHHDHQLGDKQNINKVSRSDDSFAEVEQRSPSQELVSSTQDHDNVEVEMGIQLDQWQQTSGCFAIDSSIQSNYEQDSNYENENEFDHQSDAGRLRDCSTSTDDTFLRTVEISLNHGLCLSQKNTLSILVSGHVNSKEIDPSFNTNHVALSTKTIASTLGTYGCRRSHHEDSDDDSLCSWVSSSRSSLDASLSSSISSESDSSSICSRESCYCKKHDDSFIELNSKNTNDDNDSNHEEHRQKQSDFFRKPKLKLSEEKLRKIRNRPINFKRFNLIKNSNNLKHSSNESYINDIHQPIHIFQACPKFFNNLRDHNPNHEVTNKSFYSNSPKTISSPPLKLAIFGSPNKKPTNQPQITTTPTINIANYQTGDSSRDNSENGSSNRDNSNLELINCSICGIRDKSSNTSNCYGSVSCPICTRYFSNFIRKPKELFCAQDGDCLLTFDSRCQACWIKICLKTFNLTIEQREKISSYSPKLLSAPNISIL